MAKPLPGIFDGGDPTDPKQPIALFLLQLMIIILMARMISFILRFPHQPAVIGEVVGGILLGPTALGSIPGFSNTIFPESSVKSLALFADFGKLFFLFLVGLEVNPTLVLQRIKPGAAISLTGVGVNVSAAVGMSFWLYDMYSDHVADFTTFTMFISVAVGVTAFPVLARILIEHKMLSTKVGVTVLAAAAVDDLVSWLLLGIVMSLVNGHGHLSGLWIFLTILGYFVFLFVVVRGVFFRLIAVTENSEVASEVMVMFTFILVIFSSFFTEVVGVHAIFGAFVMGVIIPKENSFAIKLMEKIEDIIIVLFVPLYFAVSGLKTDLKLVNEPKDWGTIAIVIFVAIAGKLIGCSTAARVVMNFNLRESFTVGSFMTTKGLIELIVLNIGLDSKILSPKLFAMLVVMALVTTFVAMPLFTLFYPKRLRKAARAEWELEQRELDEPTKLPMPPPKGLVMSPQTRMLVVLDHLDSVPGFAVVALAFLADCKADRSRSRKAVVHAVRVMELNERNSTILKAQQHLDAMKFDPILNTFKAFLESLNLFSSSSLVIADQASFHESILDIARSNVDNLIMLPYSVGGTKLQRLIDGGRSTRGQEPYRQMINAILNESVQHTAILCDRGFGSNPGLLHAGADFHASETVRHMSSVHENPPRKVFLPFIGGPDDRLGLEILRRFASSPTVEIVLIRIQLGPNDRVTTTGNMHPPRPRKRRSLLSDAAGRLEDESTPVTKRTIKEKLKHQRKRSIENLTLLMNAGRRSFEGRLSADEGRPRSTPANRPRSVASRRSHESLRSADGVLSSDCGDDPLRSGIPGDAGDFDYHHGEDRDQCAFRLFCESVYGQANIEIEVREHPYPWSLATSMAMNYCRSTDLIITGRRHPHLEALANLQSKADGTVEGGPSDNRPSCSPTHPSLPAIFTSDFGHDVGANTSNRSSYVSHRSSHGSAGRLPFPKNKRTLDRLADNDPLCHPGSSSSIGWSLDLDERCMLGVLGQRLCRKDVEGSVMVVQSAPVPPDPKTSSTKRRPLSRLLTAEL